VICFVVSNVLHVVRLSYLYPTSVSFMIFRPLRATRFGGWFDICMSLGCMFAVEACLANPGASEFLNSGFTTGTGVELGLGDWGFTLMAHNFHFFVTVFL